MNHDLTKQLVMAAVCIALSFSAHSQVEDIGQVFEKDGYIQELLLKDHIILINYVDKNAIYTEKLLVEKMPAIEIDAKPGTLEQLRCGMNVTVAGEHYETKNWSTATKISATTKNGKDASIELARV